MQLQWEQLAAMSLCRSSIVPSKLVLELRPAPLQKQNALQHCVRSTWRTRRRIQEAHVPFWKEQRWSAHKWTDEAAQTLPIKGSTTYDALECDHAKRPQVRPVIDVL